MKRTIVAMGLIIVTMALVGTGSSSAWCRHVKVGELSNYEKHGVGGCEGTAATNGYMKSATYRGRAVGGEPGVLCYRVELPTHRSRWKDNVCLMLQLPTENDEGGYIKTEETKGEEEKEVEPVQIVPEPTEKEPLAVTTEGGALTLETKGKTTLECTKVTGKGEFTSKRAGLLSLTLKECSSKKAKCNTSGAEAGVVLLEKATLHLVAFPKSEGEALGAVIKPKESLKITCGLVAVEVRGAVLGMLDSVKNEVKTKSAELLLHQKEGSQEVQTCEYDKAFCEKASFTLESTFGLGFEQSGLSSEEKVALAKEVEIRF